MHPTGILNSDGEMMTGKLNEMPEIRKNKYDSDRQRATEGRFFRSHTLSLTSGKDRSIYHNEVLLQAIAACSFSSTYAHSLSWTPVLAKERQA